MDEQLVAGINTALNESDVLGLKLSKDESALSILLHVISLPPEGPIDPDPRRILVLNRPSRIRVLLRNVTVGTGPERYGPPIPLADYAAIENFFDSLTWLDSMYGWRFVDVDNSVMEDWPDEVSFEQAIQEGSSDHSLYWFAECGRQDENVRETFVIEGEVTFSDLAVLRASHEPVPLETFISDGKRHWEALHTGDERMSIEGQRQANRGSQKWRAWQVTA